MASLSTDPHAHDGLQLPRKVEHNYVDHASVTEEESKDAAKSMQVNDRNFPAKLHFMLQELDNDGQSHILSWQSHGRCFQVHRQDDFVKTILPLWFRQSKFASFQRQLNLYGFKRLTAGKDKGAYYHPLFLRSKRFLAHRIPRTKLKNEGARKSTSPETEPNFYLYAPLPEEERTAKAGAESSLQASAAIATAAAAPLAGPLRHSNALSAYGGLFHSNNSTTAASSIPAYLQQQQHQQLLLQQQQAKFSLMSSNDMFPSLYSGQTLAADNSGLAAQLLAYNQREQLLRMSANANQLLNYQHNFNSGSNNNFVSPQQQQPNAMGISNGALLEAALMPRPVVSDLLSNDRTALQMAFQGSYGSGGKTSSTAGSNFNGGAMNDDAAFGQLLRGNDSGVTSDGGDVTAFGAGTVFGNGTSASASAGPTDTSLSMPLPENNNGSNDASNNGDQQLEGGIQSV